MSVATSRRAVLGGLLVAPAAALAMRAGWPGRGRPSPSGRSTTRCALCGSSRHAMLTCPNAPTVV